MNILRGFRNGKMLGTTMSATGEPAGGGGAAYVPAAGSFASTLPETLRGNEAFKDVKDPADLATRYLETQKPFALPEKYTKENPALKDIKSVDGLVDRMLGAERLVGADKNRVALMPKDDKDEAGWNAFYNTQGRPDAPDKYALPEKRADGKDYSEQDRAFQKSILPILHKAGLTQRQIAAIAPEWDQLATGAQKAHEDSLAAAAKTTSDALRTEWGGDYDAKIGLAGEAINHYSKELKLGDQVTKELDNAALGNNPGLAKLLSHIGAQLKEDGVLGKHAGGMGDGMSPEQAKTEIATQEKAFRDNTAFADKNAPGRAEALAKIAGLYEIAYPGKKPPGT